MRQATESDSPTIREFIRSEWSPDHIFVRNPDLLNWQHSERDSEKLNFLLFEEEGEIQSLLGYIPYRQWSKSVPENRVFLAIWKTSARCEAAGAGLHLLRSLAKIADASFIGAIGVSTSALAIYSRLGFQTGLMNHFVIFNPNPPSQFLESTPEPEVARGSARWVELSFAKDIAHIERVCNQSGSPKNAEYFAVKYGEHPVYDYQIYSMETEVSEVLMVTRVIDVQGALVARVVDAAGDYEMIPRSAGAIKSLVQEKSYAYMDIVSTGLDVFSMEANGFFHRKPESEYIIPGYFEPQIMKSSELFFAWKAIGSRGKAVLFRGDSDQDRPNIIGGVVA